MADRRVMYTVYFHLGMSVFKQIVQKTNIMNLVSSGSIVTYFNEHLF